MEAICALYAASRQLSGRGGLGVWAAAWGVGTGAGCVFPKVWLVREPQGYGPLRC